MNRIRSPLSEIVFLVFSYWKKKQFPLLNVKAGNESRKNKILYLFLLHAVMY